MKHTKVWIQNQIDLIDKRLEAYKAQELRMLSEDGVQAYGIGSRNLTRYNLSLDTIREAIEELEEEKEELEAELAGVSKRRAVGVVPRNW